MDRDGMKRGSAITRRIAYDTATAIATVSTSLLLSHEGQPSPVGDDPVLLLAALSLSSAAVALPRSGGAAVGGGGNPASSPAALPSSCCRVLPVAREGARPSSVRQGFVCRQHESCALRERTLARLDGLDARRLQPAHVWPL